MTAFEAELRDCLEVVLGERPPEPEYETLRFYKQWLGGRNLGLVPIEDASEFDWPGNWIARVRTLNGEHAVVMFGSPSGPLHDPANAIASGGAIEEGWVLARLDVQLPIEEPPRREARGVVEAILVAPTAEQPLHRVERVAAVAGRGLEGDRYFEGRGTFSAPGRGYELTLVDAEVLDEIELPWEEGRRNVVTRGIELNALVGRLFTVGDAVCVGRRLAEPCAHLEKVSRPDLLRPLVHRAGIRADILESGTIAAGDPVVAIE